MSNKPFDLEKALAGEPCYLKEEPDVKCYALKQFGNHIVFYSEDVECWLHPLGNLNDFLMWQEPRPRVQLELPCPLERPIETYYYIEGQSIFECSYCGTLSDYIFNKFELGLCFASKEDGQEWLDAMRNARR